jgi:hypothetical protein
MKGWFNPFPHGRGSDTESRTVNETIRAATGCPLGRERLLLRHTAVSRRKLASCEAPR